MTLRLLNHEETAALFHKRPDTWRKLWPRWVETKGFPPPVEGPPYLWDETAIRVWLVNRAPASQRERLAEAHGIAPRQENDADGFDWHRHLDERYGTGGDR